MADSPASETGRSSTLAIRIRNGSGRYQQAWVAESTVWHAASNKLLAYHSAGNALYVGQLQKDWGSAW